MKHEHPAYGLNWERVRDAVHIDSDPTPAHGIPRPQTVSALADALGWLDAQDAEYIEEIGNGDTFATLREALEIIEAFRLLYFANDYAGVNLLALDAARLCGFVICDECGVPFEEANCPDCFDPSDWRAASCADCSAPLDEFGCSTCSPIDGVCCDCCDCAALEATDDRPDLIAPGDFLTAQDDLPSPFGSALDD